MKKLSLLLFFLVALYAGWHYWQTLADRPLQARLLTISAEAIDQVTVAPPNGAAPFTLARSAEDWVVARSPRQILDQRVRAESFVNRLAELTSDSLARPVKNAQETLVTVRTATGQRDELAFSQPVSGPPRVRIVATGDVFHLPPAAARYLLPALTFDHYRESRMLHLLPGQVDSIVAVQGDSTLWVEDSVVAPLANLLLAPAAAPHADFFDEIAHRDRHHADLYFYFSGRAHRVQVFRDSLWPQPYVLVGDDFPRRFLGFSRLR